MSILKGMIALLGVSSILLMSNPGHANEVPWTDSSHELYHVDYQGDGTADDILIEGVPRQVEIPYAISVELDGQYQSFVLVRGEDGEYTLIQLPQPFSGQKTAADGLYDLSARDTSGNGTVDLIIQSRDGTSGTLIIEPPTTEGGKPLVTHHRAEGSGALKAKSFVNSYPETATLVGTSEGSFGVNHAGSATYSLPIEVAHGLNGHQPNLALNYDSRAGNGLLGMGWSLTGLPIITRCSGTPAHGDERFGGVTLQASDRLCFQGQRLVLVDGADYWSEEAQYRTEVDSQREIRRVDDGFEVTTNNGSKLIFSKLRDELWAVSSHLDAFGSVISYQYEEGVDRSMALLPASINYGQATVKFSYGKGRNDLPDGFIEGQARSLDRYLKTIRIVVDGKSVRDYELHYKYSGETGALILANVQKCAFEKGGQASQCVLPLNIEHTPHIPRELQNKQFQVSSSFSPGNVDRIVAFDWNSDGVSDLIRAAQDGSVMVRYGAVKDGDPESAYETLLPGSEKNYLITPYRSDEGERGILYMTGLKKQKTYEYMIEPPYSKVIEGEHSLAIEGGYCRTERSCEGEDAFVQDGMCLNGEWRTRTFMIRPDNMSDHHGHEPSSQYCSGNTLMGNYPAITEQIPAEYEYVIQDIYKYSWKKITALTDGGVSSPRTIKRGEFCLGADNVADFDPDKDFPRPVQGDVDSDGDLDVFLPEADCGSSHVYWSRDVIDNESHKAFPGIKFVRSIPFSFDGKNQTYVAQRNDGKFLFRENESSPEGTLKTESGSEIPSEQSVFVDLNADGLSDLVSFGQQTVGQSYDNDFIYLFLNKGGVFADPIALDYSHVESLGGGLGAALDLHRSEEKAPVSDRIRLTDYDGNGVRDLLIINGPSPMAEEHANQLLLLKTVVNSAKKPVFEVLKLNISNPNISDLENNVVLFDAEGDASHDILIAEGSTYALYGQQGSFRQKVSAFSTEFPNGEEVRTDIAYGRMNDPEIHSFQWSSKPDYRTYVGAMSLVESVTKTITSGVHDTVRFRYKDAKIHLKGRGFLGFESFSQESDLFKRKTTFDYYGSDLNGGEGAFPAFPFIGKLVRKTVENTANGQLLSIQGLHWSSADLVPDQPAAKLPFVKTRIEQRNDLAGNPVRSTRITTALDAYGNLDRKTIEHGLADFGAADCIVDDSCSLSLVEHSTAENYQYQQSLPTFLSELDVTVASPTLSVPGGIATGAYEQTTSFSYQPHEGLPYVVGTSSTTSENSEGSEVQQVYRYSTQTGELGQLESVTLKSGASVAAEKRIEPRTTHTNQYAFDVYPSRFTNALGHEESHQIDYRSGQPTQIVQADGQIHNYQYDPLGRLIRDITAPGYTVSHQYEFCGQNDCPAYALNAAYRQVSEANDDTRAVTYFDAFNRVVATSSSHFDGSEVLVTKEYDSQGRLYRTSDPYETGQGPVYSTYEYSDIEDETIVTHTDASKVTTRRTGLGSGEQTEVTRSVFRDEIESGGEVFSRIVKTTSQTNVLGDVVQVSEAIDDSRSVNTRMAHDAQGRLIWTQIQNGQDGSASETFITYDDGSQTKTLKDPDLGTTITTYNSAGEVVREVQKGLDTASGADRVLTFSYDLLGRQVARKNEVSGDIAHWYHDADSGGNSCGKGRLCAVSSPLFDEVYEYDNRKGLLTSTLTALQKQEGDDPRQYQFSYTYDSVGRENTVTYPSGLVVGRNYKNGYEYRLTDHSDGTVLWQADSYSVRDAVQAATLGNGLSINRLFDERGRLKSQTAGVDASTSEFVQSVRYGYDSLGNLAYRSDGLSDFSEEFRYDGLSRLVEQHLIEGGAAATANYAYDDYGNIQSKAGISDYRYGTYSQGGQCAGEEKYPTPGPHAVLEASNHVYCYDEYGNQVSGAGREVRYNVFNKPTQVTKGDVTITYRYGPNEERFYQQKQSPSGAIETFYVAGGQFEEEIEGGVSTLKSYVDGVLIDKRSEGTVKRVYTLRDHLGSVDTIVDSDIGDGLLNSVIERLSFAPFGERRLDGRAGTTLSPITDDRGFTDHEHMDEVGLIHMNGRVYDPAIGRFVSPDPFIQDPGRSQSYNRYSYVWNNPLALVDPSGYFGEVASDLYLNEQFVQDTISDDFWTLPETQVEMALQGLKVDLNAPPTEPNTWVPTSGQPVLADMNKPPSDEELAIVNRPPPEFSNFSSGGGASADGVPLNQLLGHSQLVAAVPWHKLRPGCQTMLEGGACIPIGQIPGRGTLGKNSGEVAKGTTKKLSKVKKEVRNETIGEGKFTKKTKIIPGKGPGQSRSEMEFVKNADGKLIRARKFSYDRANKIQHKKRVRGGPDGRGANDNQ